MKTIEFVLLLMHAADDQVEGRTALQKLAYFASKKSKRQDIGVDLEYQPHFYGPYSYKLEHYISLLGGSGYLRETMEVYPTRSTNDFDVRKYTYTLTEEGINKARELETRFPDHWSIISNRIKALMEKFGTDAALLSIAAKIDYLLGSQTKSSKEIISAAKQLNWNITQSQIKHVAKGMADIKLLKI